METAWVRSCVDLGLSPHPGSWGDLVSSGTNQGSLRPECQTGHIAPCAGLSTGRPALVMSTLSTRRGLARWHGIRAFLPPRVYCGCVEYNGGGCVEHLLLIPHSPCHQRAESQKSPGGAGVACQAPLGLSPRTDGSQGLGVPKYQVSLLLGRCSGVTVVP